VLGTMALGYLAFSLGMNATPSLVAAAVWALNFHGVNMALLWLSGRTALWLALWCLLAAAALVRRKPLLAGLAASLAMFSKEEAVVLPLILAAWAWVLHGDGQKALTRVATVARLTWPSWAGIGLYLSMRAQTGAMTPLNSPSYYRFASNPLTVLENALEYVDRACTFSALVLLVACLISARRPHLTPAARRVAILGVIWLCGTYSLTVLLPVRSSLYALTPSIAPALMTGYLLQDLWARSTFRGRRRLVIAAGLLPVLLLPVYWTRNGRWTEIADLSAETFVVARQVSQERPTLSGLVFQDDSRTRRSFANAYGSLLPEAVQLATGRNIPVRLEVQAIKDGDRASSQSTEGNTVRIVLSGGRVSTVEEP